MVALFRIIAITMNGSYQQRRSIRLRDYDYRETGAYFVTIVTQGRRCLFGDVVDGKMRLSEAGQMILGVWEELLLSYPGVETDQFVVMPNHIHGVVVLVGAGPRACPESGGQPQGVAPTGNRTANLDAGKALSLPDILHRFKSLTTQRYIRGVKESDWARFSSRLWQRNYFEHVIRSEQSLNRIRQYILDNPLHWEIDRDNPAALKPEPEYAWRQ